jgi:hypothetical protein
MTGSTSLVISCSSHCAWPHSAQQEIQNKQKSEANNPEENAQSSVSIKQLS